MTGAMEYREKDGVGWLCFPEWEREQPWVRHAFSTRRGGVSEGPFSAMNLGFGRGDGEENVRENYRRFCRAAGFPEEGLVASAQDHHTVVRRVDRADAGAGIWRPKAWQGVDGLCTGEPGVTLVTYYADCVPLYFLDPVHRAVGLAHAGWRGTVAGMGAVMAARMAEEFSSRPEELYAAIGPSIGPCCYEVDRPVAEQFLAKREWDPEAFVTARADGKFLLDLWECNRRVLLSAGLLPEHISVGKVCTRCHSDLLFSHRAMGAARGSLTAMLCIREEGAL